MKMKLGITTIIALICSANAFAASPVTQETAKINVTKKTERIVIKARPLMTRMATTDNKYLVRVYKAPISQSKVIKPSPRKGGMPNYYSNTGR